MAHFKSIEREMLLLLLSLVFFSLFSIISNGITHFFFSIIVILHAPLAIIILLKYQEGISIIKNLLLGIIILLILFGSLDAIRNFFPLSQFDIQNIGYLYYFGYPVYFDTVYISLMLAIPIIINLFYFKIFKKHAKKK